VEVKLIEVDERSGKLRLSRKVLIEPPPEGSVESRPPRSREGGRGGGRGGRGDRDRGRRGGRDRDRGGRGR
jgi:polyribonucleotide nucleotidyltransferase